jgi:hypothetical protein
VFGHCLQHQLFGLGPGLAGGDHPGQVWGVGRIASFVVSLKTTT